MRRKKDALVNAKLLTISHPALINPREIDA